MLDIPDAKFSLPTPFGALLIRLDTKMDVVQASLSKLDNVVSSKAELERVKALEERTSKLEEKQEQANVKLWMICGGLVVAEFAAKLFIK